MSTDGSAFMPNEATAICKDFDDNLPSNRSAGCSGCVLRDVGGSTTGLDCRKAQHSGAQSVKWRNAAVVGQALRRTGLVVWIQCKQRGSGELSW